jgi:pyridoxine kinase
MALLVVSSRVSTGIVGQSMIARGIAAVDARLPVYTIDTVSWTGPGNDPRRAGPVLDPADLAAMAVALLSVDHPPAGRAVTMVATGYLRTAAQVGALSDVIAARRQAPAAPLVFVDPVLGDAGRLYVDESTAAAVRDRLVPLADYIVPNETEARWLTGAGNDVAAPRLAALLAERWPGLRGLAITSARDAGGIGCLAAVRGGDGGWTMRWTGGAEAVGNFPGTGDYLAGAAMAGAMAGDWLAAVEQAEAMARGAAHRLAAGVPAHLAFSGAGAQLLPTGV